MKSICKGNSPQLFLNRFFSRCLGGGGGGEGVEGKELTIHIHVNLLQSKALSY